MTKTIGFIKSGFAETQRILGGKKEVTDDVWIWKSMPVSSGAGNR